MNTRECIQYEIISKKIPRATPEIRDNRIKLVEAEEIDRDTRREANTMVLEV